MQDVVITELYHDANLDTFCFQVHVITGSARMLALAMTSTYTQSFVDKYALWAARSLMGLRRVIVLGFQRSYQRHTRFLREHLCPTPLLKDIHPIVSMTAEGAYLLAVMDFAPAAISSSLILPD